jgi:hypothetical protein
MLKNAYRLFSWEVVMHLSISIQTEQLYPADAADMLIIWVNAACTSRYGPEFASFNVRRGGETTAIH